MVKQLAEALRQKRKAQDNVASVMRQEYPIGAPISWDRNGIHDGKVVSHGYQDRIKVRNSHTGNEFWIDAAIIVE